MRSRRFLSGGVICVLVAMDLAVVGCEPGGARLVFRQTAEKPTTRPASWRLPRAFGLGRVVPADVCLYVHWVRNPERDALRPHYERFWKQVRAAGADKELGRLLLPSKRAENPKRFERAWRRVVDRFDAVDWGSLTREEVVVLGRMKGLAPEVMLLFRDDPNTVRGNAKAMREMFEALAGLGEECRISRLGVRGAELIILTSARIDQCLQMAWRGDLIALYGGPRSSELMDDVLGLMAGQSAGPRLVDSDRFRARMAALPLPEDDLTFLDVGLAVEQMLKAQARPATRPGATSRPIGLARADRGLIRLLDVYDYRAGVGWTDGMRQHRQSITALAGNPERKGLYSALCKQRKFERFDRFVPARADAYWLWGGVNPSALHDAIFNVFRAEADDSERFMTEWAEVQREIGLSFKTDLFEWLDGRAMLISLPAESGAAEDSDLVLMLGVREPRRARTKVAQLVDRLRAASARWEQPITTRPAAVKGGDLQQLVLRDAGPTSPVFGVVGEWLILATRSAAVERCLATARGESESIRSNPRLEADGIVPDGPVSGASFVELDRIGQALGRWLGLMGLIEQYLPAGPETETVKAVFSLLDRLSVPVRALDFYASSASVTRFDGQAWRTRSVTTYRFPTGKD